MQEYKDETIKGADLLLLGCWTSGLMLFLQHPGNDWKEFALKLPTEIKSKTAIFTTYKLLSGSMFKKMRQHLNNKINVSSTEIKSRNGILSEDDKLALNGFINK